jgi:S-adenosylmethionine:tRNA ribosyltransferase-isomerase
VRVLETIATKDISDLKPQSGETNIFIYPPYNFKLVDCLITNFHLPKSTLLMLVSSLVGSVKIKEIYKFAVENKYKFFSYGDSMLLERS